MFANYLNFPPATRRDMNVKPMYFAVGTIKLMGIISDKVFISTNSTGCCSLDLHLVQADLALLAPLFACD